MPYRPCVCAAQLDRCDATCNAKMLEKTFYMACLDLGDRPCLVVGAGPIGLEKVEGLLAANARVHVVAKQAIDEIRDLAAEGAITLEERPYDPSDLEGHLLVVAATEDTALNVEIYERAEARAMLVNVVDVPPLCNFILPAIVRSGPIAIAISTSGASPALAKRQARDRRGLRRAARAPRGDPQRPARLGEGPVPDVRGPQGLLRGHRQRRPRPDRAPAGRRRGGRRAADPRAPGDRRVALHPLLRGFPALTGRGGRPYRSED